MYPRSADQPSFPQAERMAARVPLSSTAPGVARNDATRRTNRQRRQRASIALMTARPGRFSAEGNLARIVVNRSSNVLEKSFRSFGLRARDSNASTAQGPFAHRCTEGLLRLEAHGLSLADQNGRRRCSSILESALPTIALPPARPAP